MATNIVLGLDEEGRRRLCAWIEASARECEADQAKAREAGVSPQREMSLFDRNGGRHTKADWLRGAALALMPKGWRYRIAEDTQGRAVLQLLEFIPADQSPPRAK